MDKIRNLGIYSQASASTGSASLDSINPRLKTLKGTKLCLKSNVFRFFCLFNDKKKFNITSIRTAFTLH